MTSAVTARLTVTLLLINMHVLCPLPTMNSLLLVVVLQINGEASLKADLRAGGESSRRPGDGYSLIYPPGSPN